MNEPKDEPEAATTVDEGRSFTTPNYTQQEMRIHAEFAKQSLVVESDPPVAATDIVVVASNPKQMQVAQASLVAWAESKGKATLERLKEVQENLAVAIKNKWRTSTLKKVVNDLKKEISFHEKVETALRNGFVIIPNFEEIDIFAIRTMRKRPKGKMVSQHDYGGTVPMPMEQKSESPEVGEGRYVDADTKNRVNRWEKTNKDNTKFKMVSSTPDAFQSVNFPFQLAKPQIVERTAEAMKLLVFDDIGIVPGRRKVRRRGDPMVIGRIRKNKKTVVSFLITWFVDTKDL